jgi:hypothetical protein
VSAGFSADPGALRAQAGQFFGASQGLGSLVGSLGGAGRAATGDAGLDGLIARLVEELTASAGGAGIALEADGAGLLVSAANYEAADQRSRPAGP